MTMEVGDIMYMLAHRGLSKRFPENSLTAFQEALRSEFDGVETDVQMTKDGQLVLLHDAKINRTSTGKGKLAQYTYDELLHYNFNCDQHGHYNICLLEDLLRLIQESGKIVNLEIKKEALEGTVEKTVALVEKMHLQSHVYYSSTSITQLDTIKHLSPTSYCGYIVSHHLKKANQVIHDHHFDGIHARHSLLKFNDLLYYQQVGVKVGAWTLKKKKDLVYFKENNIMFVFMNDFIL
ncbi:MAG: glycerophosphodiester phosphodiesterase family protein [Sharpea porci]